MMCDKIQSNKLKHATFTAELVEISSSILVQNIECEDFYDEEFIMLYFSSKKSGGRNVKEVCLVGNGKAIVTFADSEGIFYSTICR